MKNPIRVRSRRNQSHLTQSLLILYGFVLIVLIGCASRAVTTAADNLTPVKFSPSQHITITEGSTDITGSLTITKRDNNEIRIVGLTNKIDQTIGTPNTYTLTIEQVDELFTTPGSTPITLTITDPTKDFSPGAGIITPLATFEITNVGASTATIYTLAIDFSAAAPSDWFTAANLNTYITAASFAGESAILTFDGTTITLSGGDDFTNIPGGEVALTVGTLPDGYSLTGADTLTDPDGMGLAAVDAGSAGMITITETTNTNNKQDYPVMITLGAYRSPLTATNITAMYGGDTPAEKTTASPSDITIATNMIVISGFTNSADTLESGTVTVTEPTGYTITLLPSSLSITDPNGSSAINEELGTVTVTNTRTGVAVPHKVAVNFFGAIAVSITSIHINRGMALTVTTGMTIPISAVTTEACELLAAPRVSVVGFEGSKIADTTPFPVYYDRERDMSNVAGTDTNFIVTRRIALEDRDGTVLGTHFTVTMEFPACTTFAGSGNGRSGTPYQINNAPRLELASYLVNNSNATYGAAHYEITTPIDMGVAGLPFSEMGSKTPDGNGSTGSGFLPIGRKDTNFTGTLDCASNTILRLYIRKPNTDYIGLVGVASGNAMIKNCSLTDVNITGSNNVGGLVGSNNTSTNSNSSVTGSVLGMGNNVGGLVGISSFTSTISDSYVIGAVSGMDSNVGGLIGYNSNSTISNSYANVNVSGRGTNVGGLAGYNFNMSAVIGDSYTTGSVSGTMRVGGLVGFNFVGAKINNSYATGNVSGDQLVGGLIGYNYITSSITICDHLFLCNRECFRNEY